jgi:protein-L-isoaspartate O-methyltransferase
LVRVTKAEDGTLQQERLAGVRFVPLVGGALPEDDRAMRAKASNG